MPRIVHFDISVSEPERAIEYYSEVFGWEIVKWSGPMDYWLVTTGPDDEPGINGGLSKAEEGEAGIALTVEVESVDDFLKNVTENGGSVVQPKGAIPGVGWFAMTADPLGNLLGIMEADSSAS